MPVSDILEIPFYDNDLIKLAFRFAHDVFFLALIVRFALNPNSRDREFAFTAVMLNITVFFICFTMKKLELGLGMALGLFAIFGVLRYRTDTIRTKEMTYLFIVIGIAVINALSNKKTSYLELLAVNCSLVAAAMLKEQFLARAGAVAELTATPKLLKHSIEYDNLELLALDRRGELVEDLRRRTNIDVARVQISSIDLLNSKATLTVWYNDTTK